MRLIDVSDIEKFISENLTAIGDDHLLLVGADDGRWHEALPLIKTAYDVDKVVEQLNNAKKYNLDLADKMLDIQANGTTRHFICLEDAIEIVKQGGVSDDVCEWELTDTRKVMPYKTSYGNEDLYDHRWKFCPYCGKKIKVVE